MNDNELKPCPFCGGEAKLHKVGEINPEYCVECSICKSGTATDCKTENEAISLWQARNDNNLSESTLEFINYLGKYLTKKDIYMAKIHAKIVSKVIKLKTLLQEDKHE